MQFIRPERQLNCLSGLVPVPQDSGGSAGSHPRGRSAEGAAGERGEYRGSDGQVVSVHRGPFRVVREDERREGDGAAAQKYTPDLRDRGYAGGGQLQEADDRLKSPDGYLLCCGDNLLLIFCTFTVENIVWKTNIGFYF